jgi:hypothetical protein
MALQAVAEWSSDMWARRLAQAVLDGASVDYIEQIASQRQRLTCRLCGGTGGLPQLCSRCRGRGYVVEDADEETS